MIADDQSEGNTELNNDGDPSSDQQASWYHKELVLKTPKTPFYHFETVIHNIPICIFFLILSMCIQYTQRSTKYEIRMWILLIMLLVLIKAFIALVLWQWFLVFLNMSCLKMLFWRGPIRKNLVQSAPTYQILLRYSIIWRKHCLSEKLTKKDWTGWKDENLMGVSRKKHRLTQPCWEWKCQLRKASVKTGILDDNSVWYHLPIKIKQV